MSKKNNYKREKNPFLMVVYIAAVLILLGYLAFLKYQSGQRQENFREKVKQAAANETEYEIQERFQERETVKETEKTKLKKTDGTEKQSESETETTSKEETQNADISILVLNGTRRDGVAGYWKKELEEQGYKNVISASYTGTLEEETIIYSQERKTALPFKTQFPNALIRTGSVETGIEWGQGEVRPQKIDIYIVIGNKDAQNE